MPSSCSNRAAGAAVEPSTSGTGGLSVSQPLATATGVSVGVAHVDARLKLLIPAASAAGHYNGELSISVI